MINPMKFYSLAEVEELAQQGFFPVKSKGSLIKLIEGGMLRAYNNATPESTSKKYSCKGEDLLAYLDSISSIRIEQNDKGRKIQTKKKKGLSETKNILRGEGDSKTTSKTDSHKVLRED